MIPHPFKPLCFWIFLFVVLTLLVGPSRALSNDKHTLRTEVTEKHCSGNNVSCNTFIRFPDRPTYPSGLLAESPNLNLINIDDRYPVISRKFHLDTNSKTRFEFLLPPQSCRGSRLFMSIFLGDLVVFQDSISFNEILPDLQDGETAFNNHDD